VNGLKPHLVAIFETLPHFAEMNKYAVKWTLCIQLVVGCCVWEKAPFSQYRPFCDLRSVPKASRLREQVDNRGRACIQVLFLSRAELRFSLFRNSERLAGTFH